MVAVILGIILLIIGVLLIATGILFIGAKVCKNPLCTFILGLVLGHGTRRG